MQSRIENVSYTALSTTKIIIFNFLHCRCETHPVFFPDTVIVCTKIKIFSKMMLLCFSLDMIPLFTSFTNCLQHLFLTPQLVWTNRCTYFNAYSKYNGPETIEEPIQTIIFLLTERKTLQLAHLN